MDNLATAPAPGSLPLERDHFQVSEDTSLGLLYLQTFHRRPGAVKNLSSQLEVELPEPGATLVTGNTQWLCTAPGEWLLAVRAGTEAEAALSLQGKLDGMQVVLTTASDSRVILNISGVGARNVLSRGTLVNLHRESLGAGRCISTKFAGVHVILACPMDDNNIVLYADRSVANYLVEWLYEQSIDA